MTDEEIKNKTDKESLTTKRKLANIKTNVPTSEYQRVSRELEIRDKEKLINIPWYKSWWMIYIVYPLLGVLIGSILTILLRN